MASIALSTLIYILSLLAKSIYWLCLFVGMAGLLGNIAGFKKGGKVCILSIIIYWVVTAICSAL
jgi:hypothetical protein